MALIEFLKRPVSWGAVILSYVGVFVALALGGVAVNENAERGTDLCRVVRNVNEDAKTQLATDRQALASSLDYIQDPSTTHDGLYRRVRDNLQITRDRVTASEERVESTKVPATCRIKE